MTSSYVQLSLILALLTGCGSSALVKLDAAPPDAASSEGGDSDVESKIDGAICCPPDQNNFTGCVHLGGTNRFHGCGATCDFWCSFNWRIEKDEDGCDVWRMDYRMPDAGENAMCRPDGGAVADTYLDIATDAASDRHDGISACEPVDIGCFVGAICASDRVPAMCVDGKWVCPAGSMSTEFCASDGGPAGSG